MERGQGMEKIEGKETIQGKDQTPQKRARLCCFGIRNLGEMLAQANLPRALSQGQLFSSSTSSLHQAGPHTEPYQHHHQTAPHTQHNATCCPPQQLNAADRAAAAHRSSELYLERFPTGGVGGGRSASPSPVGSIVRSTLDLAAAAGVSQEATYGGHDPNLLDPRRGGSGGIVKHWTAGTDAAFHVVE